MPLTALIPLHNVTSSAKLPCDFAGGTLIRVEAPGDLAVRVAVADKRDAREALDRLLVLFKLWRGTPLWVDRFIIDAEGMGKRLLHYQPHGFAPAAHLTADEIDDFNAFCEEHTEVPLKNFAVGRYARADHRPYLKDQFVDYVAALEHLLTPNQQGGLSHALRTRGCMVLGAELTPEARRELHDDLRNACKLRGYVVHGVQKGYTDTREWWAPHLKRVSVWARDAILLFWGLGVLSEPADRKKLLEDATVFGVTVTLPPEP